MQPIRVIDHITVEEYLEAELTRLVRHEYVSGEIFPRPECDIAHSVITTNIAAGIANAAVPTPYRTHMAAMKLQPRDDVIYYPDVMLVCSPLLHPDSHVEPSACIVVEVVNDATARVDLLEKRLIYMGMSDLQLYLIVDSRKRKITGYYRAEDGWAERKFNKEDLIDIPCVNAQLTFEQIYAKSDR